jgi:hypothetical protein
MKSNAWMPRKLYLLRGSSGLVRIANLIIEHHNRMVGKIKHNMHDTAHDLNVDVYNQHIRHMNNADRILRQMHEVQ